VLGSDIADGVNFLCQPAKSGIGVIITNPPYALAREFIERALSLDSVRVDLFLDAHPLKRLQALTSDAQRLANDIDNFGVL
jgi:hypothetical protein